MNYELSNILFVFPYFIEISKNKILILRCTCCYRQSCVKRLLHDIFHIGPGISPRLPYQARQRRYGSRVDTRDDMENFMS